MIQRETRVLRRMKTAAMKLQALAKWRTNTREVENPAMKAVAEQMISRNKKDKEASKKAKSGRKPKENAEET